MNRRLLLLLSSALLLSGCAVGTGVIYTKVTEPLDINMNNTPFGSKYGESDITKVVEPFTGAQMAVEIYSNAIGDAARRADLKVIYYADLRREEILFGIFQKRTVLVYGE